MQEKGRSSKDSTQYFLDNKRKELFKLCEL